LKLNIYIITILLIFYYELRRRSHEIWLISFATTNYKADLRIQKIEIKIVITYRSIREGSRLDLKKRGID
jgi:hypothetical protein